MANRRMFLVLVMIVAVSVSPAVFAKEEASELTALLNNHQVKNDLNGKYFIQALETLQEEVDRHFTVEAPDGLNFNRPLQGVSPNLPLRQTLEQVGKLLGGERFACEILPEGKDILVRFKDLAPAQAPGVSGGAMRGPMPQGFNPEQGGMPLEGMEGMPMGPMGGIDPNAGGEGMGMMGQMGGMGGQGGMGGPGMGGMGGPGQGGMGGPGMGGMGGPGQGGMGGPQGGDMSGMDTGPSPNARQQLGDGPQSNYADMPGTDPMGFSRPGTIMEQAHPDIQKMSGMGSLNGPMEDGGAVAPDADGQVSGDYEMPSPP